MTTISTYELEILALCIRNSIAAREFNTAQANRELQSGDGWLWDHAAFDRKLADDIHLLIDEARKEVTNACPVSKV